MPDTCCQRLAEELTPIDITDGELSEIAIILNRYRNFDISHYKDSYLKRRIAIRMRYTGVESATDYCELIRSDEHELEALLKALTIHVSQFFRNSSVFDLLKVRVLPEMLHRKAVDEDKELEIVCIGSSTGEEPYSLAIMLKEYFRQETERLTVKISGLEIDLQTIKRAVQGCYPQERVKTVTPEIMRKYFTSAADERWQLDENIRSMVSFRCVDICSVDSFGKADMVLCRNTLIYFNRSDQEKIVGIIADTLKPDGILVLGRSETLTGKSRRLFDALSVEERIYRKALGG